MYFHIILRSAACKTAHISYFIVPHSVDYCKKFHLFFKESTKYSKRGSPFRLPQDSQKSQISGIMYADAQWASLQSGCSAYISVGTTIGRPKMVIFISKLKEALSGFLTVCMLLQFIRFSRCFPHNQLLYGQN